ncbi:MAG TPA: hypothetical protein VK694_04505 [Verrucomicrobiae bacterium]|nr:hypothetical protein [Verrucomicrobiae bacterium]
MATNGRIDVRPDGTTRTWDCGTTRSGTADAPGTYALGVLDKDSGDFVLATFTVDTES